MKQTSWFRQTVRTTRGIAIALMILALSACSDDDGHGNSVRLAVNPWTGSAVDAAVARILLEEEVGKAVEIVEIDEFTQWESIASGELHACLEVWPSGHQADILSYIIRRGTVEDGGDLGVVGKIGWYVPAYVVAEHPELATWEGFRDPENAALFRTPESGESGQFLAGDPTWVQYDQQIIDNLELPFERVVAGSEGALLDRIDAAYAAREPLLFYFFTPHSVHHRLDLVEVELPPYSEECYARAEQGGIDCDYPTDQLFKIFWPGLQEQAPDAYRLLSRMSYTTADQIEMIALVDSDGLTPDEAARVWLDEHPGIWRSWLED